MHARGVIKTISLLLWGFMLLSCGSSHRGLYKLSLQDVVCTPAPAMGDMMFSTAERPDGATYYMYDTPYLKATWRLTHTKFELELENKTTDTLTVFWEDAIYINQKSDSLRVVLERIDFFDKDKPLWPTDIEPGGALKEFIIPADHIIYDPDNFNLWSIKHLFYEGKKDIGQYVSMVLPLQFSGEVYRYTFIFLVEDWKEER
ncbi:MAG: hypothetical protein WBK97_05050 [Bacteroidales bacterium]|jgi:hypothetical protein